MNISNKTRKNDLLKIIELEKMENKKGMTYKNIEINKTINIYIFISIFINVSLFVLASIY